jgi:hypothetical protein
MSTKVFKTMNILKRELELDIFHSMIHFKFEHTLLTDSKELLEEWGSLISCPGVNNSAMISKLLRIKFTSPPDSTYEKILILRSRAFSEEDEWFIIKDDKYYNANTHPKIGLLNQFMKLIAAPFSENQANTILKCANEMLAYLNITPNGGREQMRRDCNLDPYSAGKNYILGQLIEYDGRWKLK